MCVCVSQIAFLFRLCVYERELRIKLLNVQSLNALWEQSTVEPNEVKD